MRLLGPAFVAAVAYVDPGNVAANLTAGAQYGYLLVWVLVAANLMAMLVQYLSAKLGLVTGRSLPELLGHRLPRGRRLAYWVQAEIVAAATDLAEVIGGAIALHILFGIPLLAGGVIVGVVSSTSNGGTSRIALNNGKTYNATNGLAVPANGSVGRTDGTCRLGLDRTEACGTTGQSPYSVAGSTGASSTAVTAISLYRSITVSGYGTTVVYLNATGVGTNLSVSAAPLI